MASPRLFLSATLLAAAISFCYTPKAPAQPADLPVVHQDDFSGGMEQWKPTDPKAWKITEVDGNPVLENLGGSKYEPPHRSPRNIALLEGIVVGDFVLTARVQTTKKSYGHRDMCLFFGYQDPSNFYYMHLGQVKDPHANQIFLVQEAPRVAISEKASDGTPWKDETWHEVKIVRDVASGLIEVYFDDMETPTHVAHDKSFTWGQIGLGTFDDKGLWDDVELRGVRVERPTVGKPTTPLQYENWTPDFAVPDPVAISFDPQGRAYVTQTRRRKANDLDIRQNMDWLVDDLRFESTGDKENFYREQFTPENSEANAKRVKDFNGDGVHDIADLTALTERVHLIADTDGDGFADTMHTYAEELDHLIGGVAGGVLFHQGDVYVSPVPELVRFRDTNDDGKADEKEVIASGFGVHLAYAGHDMHGLFVGPDGRIYWSIGDKGMRVKTAEGLDYRFPNQGVLMRCEPDGSNFEVYARGLRNIQEASFDQYGNFFGVDNDADYPGEKERLIHIEQYLDAGWRANWQYLRDDYNPWVDDEMHVPWHEGQPRWFTPPLSNYENGPAGFKFNPGTALGPEYQNYFFLTSAPNGQQWAFQVKPYLDRFAMVNDHQIGKGVPIVGLNFAPDGALYGVDWGGGYPLNEKGAVWRIDVPENNQHLLRSETKKWIETDVRTLEEPELVNLLGFPDQRVRLKAQLELARRESFNALGSVATDTGQQQIARIHAIWGLGQILRAGGPVMEESLALLFHDADPEIRAQAIRTAADRQGRTLGLDVVPPPTGKRKSLTAELVGKLDDPSQRVRIQALLALGRTQDTAATDAIVAMLGRKGHSVDLTYLRHAGVVALAGCAPVDTLAELDDHESDFVRACAVIALRRRGDEAVSRFLDDPDPVTAADAARAIHDDWMIPLALLDLAEALGTHRESEGFTRRAINANFRIGTPECADRVAAFVAKGRAPEPLLAAGLEALQHWTEPGPLDLVVGRYRPLEPRDPGVVREALGRHLDAMLTSKFSSVRSTAMDLARASELEIAADTLVAVAGNVEAKPELRATALRSLASQEAPQLAAAVESALGDSADLVRTTSLELLAALDVDAALGEIGDRLDSDASVSVRQHAIRTLPAVFGNEALEPLVAALADGSLDPTLQLDVFETAKDPAFGDDRAISEPVAALEAKWQGTIVSDPTTAFAWAREGGDVERGRSVFINHAAAQCIRCHKIEDGKGSDVGPNLKAIGKDRDADHLLESLVDPQREVTEGYGNLSVTLEDGTSLAGQYRGEKDGRLLLRDPEGKDRKIPLSKIASRTPVVSTMPPMGLILKKDELRDVMAFLRALRG